MTKIAAYVQVKNEASNFLEWLCFHKAAGIDTLIVYDNESTDGTDAIARKAGTVFDVRVKTWPTRGKMTHFNGYRDVLAASGAEFDWIAFIDADELLFAPGDREIGEILGGMPDDAGAVGVHWLCYGSSGRMKVEPGLMVDQFQRRSPDDFSTNRHFKSIVRPQAAMAPTSAHTFDLAPGYRLVQPDGATYEALIKPGKGKAVIGADLLRINHYYTRSREQYERRLSRGQVTGGKEVDDFARMDRNDLHDNSAIKYRDATEALMRQVAG